jgi:hypothetical protein
MFGSWDPDKMQCEAYYLLFIYLFYKHILINRIMKVGKDIMEKRHIMNAQFRINFDFSLSYKLQYTVLILIKLYKFI